MFVLIVPPVIKYYKDYDQEYAFDMDYYSGPGYGAAIVSSFLRKNNIKVRVIDYFVRQQLQGNLNDFFFEDYQKEIEEILRTGNCSGSLDEYVNNIFNETEYKEASVIGFSIHSFGHFVYSILLAKRIKEKLNIPIIFGGCFISCFHHLYPELSNWIDIIYKGDVGNLLVNVVNGTRKIKKFTVLNESSIDFQELPLPDFTDIVNDYRNLSKSELILPYEPTRGCVHNCNFCLNPHGQDPYKSKNIARIVDDLLILKTTYDCKFFQFCDYNIGGNKQFLEDLMRLFIKKNLDIRWRSHLSIGNVDKNLLTLLAQGGAESLAFGVESGSEKILKKIQKGNSVAMAEQVLRMTTDVGIKTNITLMVGYPHETNDDIEATLNFLERNKNYISNTVIRVYGVMEHSEITTFPEKYGITNLKELSLRFHYSYDEINGLSWKEKRAQITKSYLVTRKFLKTGQRISF